jgi:hypothetical protein
MRRLLHAASLLLLLSAPDRSWAAIVGFHDVSDAVKTSGWVCDTAGGPAVVVHLYADVQGGMRWVDSQVANQRRADVGGRDGVCPTERNGFRFADYAANDLGSTLYDATGPVSLFVVAEAPGELVPLSGTPRPVSFAPVGIRDAGLTQGRWRTDLSNPDEGTHAVPLALGECLFSTPLSDGYMSFSGGGFSEHSGCRYDETSFPRSNAATSEPQWPTRDFWVVVANVEDAFANPFCTDGPPGQSLPIGPPGSGEVFGVVALPDTEADAPARKKFHLVLNSASWSRCRVSSYGGPYLAFGAQAERGNDGVITYLNRPGAPTTLRFGMTLMETGDDVTSVKGAPPDARRYSQAHVLVEAAWGGVKRWLFVEIVPDVRLAPGAAVGVVDVHVRFNWHLLDSMMYPGADYLYKSGTVLSRQCEPEQVSIPVFDRRATYVNPKTRADSRIDFSIDLQRVFDCLQRRGEWGRAAMPQHAVPVTGVFFGVEQDDRLYHKGDYAELTAPNVIWVAVDSVRVD